MNAATEDDLVKRMFTADWPDAPWLTDITGHPSDEDKLFDDRVTRYVSTRRHTGHKVNDNAIVHRQCKTIPYRTFIIQLLVFLTLGS